MPDQVTLDIQMRQVSVMPESVNAESRTFDIVFTTGADVERYDWSEGERYIEELVVSPEAVDLSRLNNGAPVLDTHSSYDLDDIVAGVVPGSARIEGGQGHCTIQFLPAGVDEESDVLFAKVRAGIIRNISVGYRIIAATEIRNPGELLRIRVDKWQPMEVSLVPMGADDECVVRSSTAASGENRRQFSATVKRSGVTTMPNENDAPASNPASSAPASVETRNAPAQTDEQRQADLTAARNAGRDTARSEIVEMIDLAAIGKRSIADVRAWLRDGKSVADVRAAIADAAATEAEQTATRSQHSGPENGGNSLADNMRKLVGGNTGKAA